SSRVTTTAPAHSDIEIESDFRRVTTHRNNRSVGTSAFGRPFIFLDSSTDLTEEVSDSGTRHRVASLVSAFETDDFGNTTFQSVIQQDTSTRAVTEISTTFDVREDPWLISLPDRRSVDDSIFDGTGTLPEAGRTTQYEFDELGLLSSVIREPD